MWNITYDGVFGFRMPDEAAWIGFTGDLAVATVAMHRRAHGTTWK